jgi:hypothetical protein
VRQTVRRFEVAEIIGSNKKKKATDKKLSEVATTAINVDLAEDEIIHLKY